MKATNLVPVGLFLLHIPSAFSSLLNYNGSESTLPFPVQANLKPFDHLELVQNWQISHCVSTACVINPDEIFTIHWLWPVLEDGTAVTGCSPDPLDRGRIADLNDLLDGDLKRLWPSLHVPYIYNFWAHDWNEHGGCTPFRQEKYFRTAYNVRKKYDFLDYLHE